MDLASLLSGSPGETQSRESERERAEADRAIAFAVDEAGVNQLAAC